MDWTVAGPTRKTPDMLARRRYLKVYWPAGSRSKKKFVPLSRVSSYQARPRSHRCRETALSGSHPAARGSRRCTYSASCLDESETWTSTSSPGAIAAPSARGFKTKPEGDASRLKYFRETEKKSPRLSSGSFSFEKSHCTIPGRRVSEGSSSIRVRSAKACVSIVSLYQSQDRSSGAQ